MISYAAAVLFFGIAFGVSLQVWSMIAPLCNFADKNDKTIQKWLAVIVLTLLFGTCSSSVFLWPERFVETAIVYTVMLFLFAAVFSMSIHQRQHSTQPAS